MVEGRGGKDERKVEGEEEVILDQQMQAIADLGEGSRGLI
jgi:hypothetical protein